MEREQKRYTRVLPQIEEKALLGGEISNPFNDTETKIIKSWRDGLGKNAEIAAAWGKAENTIKKAKEKITSKVREMYQGGGTEEHAKAVSLAILGGWVEPLDTQIKRRLTPHEIQVFLFAGYGNTHQVIRSNLGMNEKNYDELVDTMKADFNLKTDLQLVALGASIGREKVLAAKTLSDEVK